MFQSWYYHLSSPILKRFATKETVRCNYNHHINSCNSLHCLKRLKILKLKKLLSLQRMIKWYHDGFKTKPCFVTHCRTHHPGRSCDLWKGLLGDSAIQISQARATLVYLPWGVSATLVGNPLFFSRGGGGKLATLRHCWPPSYKWQIKRMYFLPYHLRGGLCIVYMAEFKFKFIYKCIIILNMYWLFCGK